MQRTPGSFASIACIFVPVSLSGCARLDELWQSCRCRVSAIVGSSPSLLLCSRNKLRSTHKRMSVNYFIAPPLARRHFYSTKLRIRIVRSVFGPRTKSQKVTSGIETVSLPEFPIRLHYASRVLQVAPALVLTQWLITRLDWCLLKPLHSQRQHMMMIMMMILYMS